MHQLIDKKNKIVIYLIFLLVLSTTSNKTKNYQENLPIANKITISGLSSSNDLILIKKLQNFFYINIFILKKDKINKIISEFNIVEEYNVRKVYPSKLNIEIKPAKFIAKIYDNSQLLVGSNGKLIKSETINDKRIDALEERYKSTFKLKGYRIQIHSGNKRQPANQARASFSRVHPKTKAHLNYEQPYYKVRVGDFKTKLEALKYKTFIIKEFPNSFKMFNL